MLQQAFGPSHPNVATALMLQVGYCALSLICMTAGPWWKR